jgi:hypothetical protein
MIHLDGILATKTQWLSTERITQGDWNVVVARISWAVHAQTAWSWRRQLQRMTGMIKDEVETYYRTRP